MKFALEIVVAVATINLAYGYYYKETLLENYCGATLRLGCPYSYVDVSKRAGTLRFRNLPRVNCTVFVITDNYCSNNAAIYLNIKKSSLPRKAGITIYENATYSSTGLLVKVIPGGETYPQLHPTSIAQLLSSSYTVRPSFTIKLTTDGSQSSAYEVLFDFVTLLSKSTQAETYCSALGGYILSDAYDCKIGDDRVTCPYRYYTSTYTDNFATDIQECELTDIEIAGIIAGAVVAFVILSAICSAFCKTEKKVATATPYRSFGNTSEPIVTGAAPGRIGGAGDAEHAWRVRAATPSLAPARFDPPPPYPTDEIVLPPPYPTSEVPKL